MMRISPDVNNALKTTTIIWFKKKENKLAFLG